MNQDKEDLEDQIGNIQSEIDKVMIDIQNCEIKVVD